MQYARGIRTQLDSSSIASYPFRLFVDLYTKPELMEVESGRESADTCSDNENFASSHVGNNSYGVVDISPTVSIENRTAQKSGNGFSVLSHATKGVPMTLAVGRYGYRVWVTSSHPGTVFLHPLRRLLEQ